MPFVKRSLVVAFLLSLTAFNLVAADSYTHKDLTERSKIVRSCVYVLTAATIGGVGIWSVGKLVSKPERPLVEKVVTAESRQEAERTFQSRLIEEKIAPLDRPLRMLIYPFGKPVYETAEKLSDQEINKVAAEQFETLIALRKVKQLPIFLDGATITLTSQIRSDVKKNVDAVFKYGLDINFSVDRMSAEVFFMKGIPEHFNDFDQNQKRFLARMGAARFLYMTEEIPALYATADSEFDKKMRAEILQIQKNPDRLRTDQATYDRIKSMVEAHQREALVRIYKFASAHPDLVKNGVVFISAQSESVPNYSGKYFNVQPLIR